jgi:hypothetical protein
LPKVARKRQAVRSGLDFFSKKFLAFEILLWAKKKISVFGKIFLLSLALWRIALKLASLKKSRIFF